MGATAPRSLTALTLQQAIKLDGGTAPVEVVPLPQNQLGKAANDGSVKAVAVVEPFPAQALKEYPALMSLGDSTGQVFPVGAAYTGFFTTSQKAASLKSAVDAFRRGMAKAVEFGNKSPGEVKKAGAKLAGLDEATALTLPDGRFSTGVDQAGLDILVKAMVDQAWIKAAPNLSAFLSGLK